jgi:hypothetical protein
MTVLMHVRKAPFFIVMTLVGAGAGFANPALAAEQASLGDFLLGSSRMGTPPAVARYEVGSLSGGSFVLDTAPGKPAYLKFDGSPEIWALRPYPGPRGDVIYKNDAEEPVLRATRLGGVTLFTPHQPEGMPAAFVGQAPPPRLVVDMDLDVLWNIFVQSSARASHIAQHLVVFEGPQNVTPASAPVFADAAIITSQAFAQVGAQGRSGQTMTARIFKVEFTAGRNPAASCKGEVVTITVAPLMGVAGRPSSERVAKVIMRN